MRRAGLDYHEYAGICTYEGWKDFLSKNEAANLYGISTKGSIGYADVQYQQNDFVIFGPETRGLPESAREEIGPEKLLRIPMLPESRSLNLSNAAAVVVYEAWRQLGFASGS